VRESYPENTKLVLTIENVSGQQVRRCELDKSQGLHRVAWPLNTDPPAGGRGGAGGRAGAGGGGGQGGGGRGAAANADSSATPALQPCEGSGGGRGGRGGGAGRVPDGSYEASIGKMVGTTVTPIGPSQPFMVRPLPE